MNKLTEEQKELVRERDYLKNELYSILIAKRHPTNFSYVGCLSEQDCINGIEAIEKALGLNDE